MIGLGGYNFIQTTDDDGPNAAQAKVRAFSVGPSVRDANDKNWLPILKWHKETNVLNRPVGSQLYLKATIPF